MKARNQRRQGDTEDGRQPDQAHPEEDHRGTDPWSQCSHSLVSDDRRGEVFCRRCGLVVETNAFDGPIPEGEEPPGPLARWLRQLLGGTARGIGTEDKDGKGFGLNVSARRRLRRLAAVEWRNRPSRRRERSIAKAITFLLTIRRDLELPDTLTIEAISLYLRAAHADLVVGRSSRAFAAAAVLAASRSAGIPLGLKEISRVTGVRPRQARKALVLLRKELGLSWTPTDPQSFIPRLASKLAVPWPVEQEARKLLAVAKDRENPPGGSPLALAAAALVVASSGSLSESEVCRSAGLSRGSVTRWRKELARCRPKDELGRAPQKKDEGQKAA